MTIDEGLPASIRERFAGREAAVRQAYRDSEPFRAVCRDYLACARALDRWKASRSEEAPLRAHEYAELLVELAGELEARLRRWEQ